MIAAINWDFSAELIEGYKTPNWYGILFVTGLILGYFVVKRMYKKEGISNDALDKLVLFMVVPTIVGARLGHVLFYGPWFDLFDPQGFLLERGYFSHPLDIFKVWEGGLASHGAAIAILFSLWYYSKKIVQKPYLWTLDRISAPIAIGGTFIRLGNLVNHEMVGHETNVPWGFRFLEHDRYLFDGTWESIPVRHPAQLYEAICYFIGFLVLMFLYWKRDLWKKPGVVFGAFLIFFFGARILVEFFKLGQSETDDKIAAMTGLNTGQWLSVPLVLTGIYLIWSALKKKTANS